MEKYVRSKKASQMIGIHPRTLYQWEKKGKIKTIRTPGGHRLYDVHAFLNDLDKNKINNNVNDNINIINKIDKNNEKIKIGYVRVSSIGQKNDLERQKFQMQKLYPNHMIIEDIGSGMNMNRRGLRKIIKLAIGGKIDEVVIAYKDRLARFGYELIEDLIKEYSQGKIIIINRRHTPEPEEEIVQDVLQIMNIFVAKMNGMRKYKIKKI